MPGIWFGKRTRTWLNEQPAVSLTTTVNVKFVVGVPLRGETEGPLIDRFVEAVARGPDPLDRAGLGQDCGHDEPARGDQDRCERGQPHGHASRMHGRVRHSASEAAAVRQEDRRSW